MTIDSTTGQISGTPAYADSGTYTITVTAYDSTGPSVTKTLSFSGFSVIS